MKERLIIQNFGPIKSVDLDLGKMSVLIGPSASGKSTTLKVLAICRYFSYLVVDNDTWQGLGFDGSSTSLQDWDLEGFENNDSYISYENEDYSVVFTTKKVAIVIGEDLIWLAPALKAKSKRFKVLLKRYFELVENDKKLDMFGSSIPLQFWQGEVREVMGNPFYTPTERALQSIFSLGKSSIQNLSDTLFNQFALFDGLSKSFKEETEVEPLNISYKNVNGHGYFKEKGSDQFYPMSKAASGFKSAAPIVLATKYYSLKERRSRTFLVEEPEQNIFPETHKKLVEYLVGSINDYGHRMLMATHSPYVLTALENLMYAHKLGTAQNGRFEKEVENIVEKQYWINQEDISVYFLGDEEVDLMQRDEALINKEYIDSISKVVNEVFDKLLDIELKIENN